MRTSTTASELDHEILQQGSEAPGAAHSASGLAILLQSAARLLEAVMPASHPLGWRAVTVSCRGIHPIAGCCV